MIREFQGAFSVFDFDVEDPLQSQPKLKPRNQQKRACAWTFQEMATLGIFTPVCSVRVDRCD